MGRRPSQLHIANGLSFPLEAITQTFGILATKGAGKTYTSMVVAEEMLKTGMPVVILDPLGVCWGLRSSASGKRAGLPITIFGGEHADIPLESTSGEMIADLIVRERISAVLDMSKFNNAEQDRFAAAFAARLYHKNRKPLHLMVDEADSFAPQKPMRGQEKMLGAFNDIVRRGRARGLGVTLISQRSAVISKNVLTQIEVLIVLRTNAPQDRKAIAAWTDVHGDEEKNKQMMDSLAKLAIGEAWVWSAGWLDIFKKVKIRRRDTFDSSATPKFGSRIKEPKKLAPVDLKRIQEQMAETIEKAKQDDPRELRRQVVELKRQLEKKVPVEVKAVVKEKVVVKEVSVPMLSKREQKMIWKLIKALGKNVATAVKVNEIANHLGKDFPRITSPVRTVTVPPDLHALMQGRAKVKGGEIVPTQTPVKPIRRELIPANPEDEAEKLLAGERRMIEVLARVQIPLTTTQIATLAGLAPGSGTVGNYFGKLIRLKYMSKSGKNVELLKTPNDIRTDPLTREEVLMMWKAKFLAGERRMLDILIELDGKAIPIEELAKRAGLSYPSGTFSNYEGKLRRNGLADKESGMIKLSDTMFLGT